MTEIFVCIFMFALMIPVYSLGYQKGLVSGMASKYELKGQKRGVGSR